MTHTTARIVASLVSIFFLVAIGFLVSAPPPLEAVGEQTRSSTYLPLVLTFGQAPQPTQPTQPVLLSSYIIRPHPQYEAAHYTPRGMDAPPYEGWDLLSLPGKTLNDGVNTTMSNPDWLTLTLNRPAVLAVVWRGTLDPPTWLQAWTRAEDVTIDGQTYPTYRQVVPAGSVTLGGVNNPGVSISQPTYLVLLAEADGSPSRSPAVAGERETPRPNQPCPRWVHDQYVTTAPDGKTYPTWHPQIDPVYWCYFGHEHGSDPALSGSNYLPAYGYTAAAAGQDEGHAGFKTYVFDDEVGHWWIITHHFGTASLRRACARFHTVDVAIIDRATGERVADVHHMGDFGKSVVNKTEETLTPSACPDQGLNPEAESSTGVRMLPVATRDSVGYEPWRMSNEQNVIGFSSAGLTFNTPNAVVICDDIVCDTPVSTGFTGAFRFFTFSTDFALRAGAHTGVFHSDPRAQRVISADVPGAVQQYIQPGLNAAVPAHAPDEGFYPTDPWRALFICAQQPPADKNMNLEGALQSPN